MSRMHVFVPPPHRIHILGREHACYDDLMAPYLAQHPRRKEALERAMPGAAKRLRGAWRVAGDRLLLERLWLKGAGPADNELAWHILFSGLKAPLTAFWVDGRVYYAPAGLSNPYMMDHLTFTVQRGAVDERSIRESAHADGSGDDLELHTLPLGLRVLALVIVDLIALPLMIVHVFHPFRGSKDPRAVRLKNLLVLPAMLVVMSWYGLRGMEDDGKGFAPLRRAIAWLERERELAAAGREVEELTRKAFDQAPRKYWSCIIDTSLDRPIGNP